ncbi:glycosyl transferase family 2 [Hasllibacter halocynthiae]|uniref:Glycosyl transferase family 2 n=1 Tax=Hasllibacter halocynthiae TaxID=595589 RepID=A0A2T0X249_9RHOB|nr:glycosyltransferase family 2 protein [Hasllibacter halocynthiae]PRY93010.1 glycosyl transferase family 2 [Hasllibacter halocynthiae]
MGIIDSYRMRVARRRLRLRALRKSRELSILADRTGRIGPRDVVVLATIRNERLRLPYFLRYYRGLGVGHFLLVDNGSDDGGAEYLRDQPDVSLWHAEGSYRSARFGTDWTNHLASRHADGHWVLTVDPDEFFVYPFCDTRPVTALCDWLDVARIRAFPAMLLDMYPKGPIDAQPYQEGQDPLEIASWFDSGNYFYRRNARYGNLWIQGGPRMRAFFADDPSGAPALNKIPLVRWRGHYAYASSTHMLLPRGLNRVYDDVGGEKASGVLLHAKFLSTFGEKVEEELERRQHYGAGREYAGYAGWGGKAPDLWNRWSEKYINWRQLEVLGLISKGNWV